MALTSWRVVRIALVTLICYFAVFSAACWICDLFFPGAFGYRFWERLFVQSGEILMPAVFVTSFFVWRRIRWLAIIGFLSCIMWTVWAVLPRLWVVKMASNIKSPMKPSRLIMSLSASALIGLVVSGMITMTVWSVRIEGKASHCFDIGFGSYWTDIGLHESAKDTMLPGGLGRNLRRRDFIMSRRFGFCRQGFR